ncbi:hypothetical protein NBE98_15565 [Clostridium swellfunianum]|uniref:hypothetical protein n=1 Tax=Clostridium swellfunianum TaxID=1367462 RepID=UPI002030C869|nr:hypothetical protein [Clostridium swellfunianum]MCM0649784.1 hypothetical protein [Clostridium swellfunianum]
MNNLNKSIETLPKGEVLNNNIEVWEDLVNIKDLLISLIVCSITTLGGYFAAPNKPPKPLLFGLTGAIVGFVICSILVKPKRTFVEINKEN